MMLDLFLSLSGLGVVGLFFLSYTLSISFVCLGGGGVVDWMLA